VFYGAEPTDVRCAKQTRNARCYFVCICTPITFAVGLASQSIDRESGFRCSDSEHLDQTYVARISQQDVPCRVVGGEAPAHPSLALYVLIREPRGPPATSSAACLSCCRLRVSAFFVLKAASRTYPYTLRHVLFESTIATTNRSSNIMRDRIVRTAMATQCSQAFEVLPGR
jgi:hypothetical protein